MTELAAGHRERLTRANSVRNFSLIISWARQNVKQGDKRNYSIPHPVWFVVGYWLTSVAHLVLDVVRGGSVSPRWASCFGMLIILGANIAFGAFFALLFTGWFYLRARKAAVSTKSLSMIFGAAGILLVFGLAFPFHDFIDLLESWGITGELVSCLCFFPWLLWTVLLGETGFRVARKLAQPTDPLSSEPAPCASADEVSS